MMELHSILLFIHIILMGYWLGGDLGVYLAANRVADPTLPIDERLRFLHLAMKLDMGPRTADITHRFSHGE
jgi:putative copper export protein